MVLIRVIIDTQRLNEYSDRINFKKNTSTCHLTSYIRRMIMKAKKHLLTILMLAVCFFATPGISLSQEGSDSGSNPLMEGLMSILQESIDEFIGNYKGSLGDVKLLERLGNKVVLEVTYNNIKRSDNVHVQGQVLDMGTPLENFNNSLNTVYGSSGKVRLAIKWSPQADEDWGTTPSEVVSDQIRLYLIRKSNPERPFGEIIYDLPKTWTGSDEPDEQAIAAADDDGIELEDGEIEAGSDSADTAEPSTPSGPSGVFIKPGTILIPRTGADAARKVEPAKPAASNSTVKTVPSTPQTPQLKTTVKPVQAKPVMPVYAYDFYSKAGSGAWRSSAGQLNYPGPAGDPKGYARPVFKGKLNPGTAAVSMIEMRPEDKQGGWIDVHFPEMILGNNVKFKTVAGFLFGSNRSNNATFMVYVKEGNRYHRVIRYRTTAEKYVPLAADLSGWSGKKVQIVLRLRSNGAGNARGAVWVKPRLTR